MCIVDNEQNLEPDQVVRLYNYYEKLSGRSSNKLNLKLSHGPLFSLLVIYLNKLTTYELITDIYGRII